MRIVYLYNGEPFDENLVNETWGTSQGLAYQWKLMGHEVVEINFSSLNCENLLFEELTKKHTDVVLLSEAGTIPQHVQNFWKKERFPDCLMVAEGCDEPQILRYNLLHTLPAELIWSPDLDATNWYLSQGKNAFWLPHWGDEVIYSRTADPCNGTISTSASGPRRGIWNEAIFALNEKYGEKFLAPRLNGGPYLSPYDNNKLYECSSLVFTMSSNAEITRRLFEAAASGRMVICDRLDASKSLNAIFEEGKDIECFDSLPELMYKVDLYLNNHDARMEMADNAHKKYMNFHTAKNRANQLCEVFKQVQQMKART